MIGTVIPIGALIIQLLAVPTVQAQTSNVTCLPSFSWASNSLGQSPCLQAAWLQAECNGGNFRVDTIPPGYHYIGPTTDKATENACICTTVVYNLMSACGACQNLTWISWLSWSFYCRGIPLQEGSYNATIPFGTAIPAWAFDIPRSHGELFNVTIAQNIGDQPEVIPVSSTSTPTSTFASISAPTPSSTVLSASKTLPTGSVVSPTSSSSPTLTRTSEGGGSSSNAGAIAGGVVGGVVGLGLIVIAVFLLLRKQKRSQQLPSPHSGGALISPGYNGVAGGGALNMVPGSPVTSTNTGPQPEMGTANDQPMTFPNVYNPNDPTTYPSTPTPSPSYLTSPQQASFPGQPSFPERDSIGRYSGVPEV